MHVGNLQPNLLVHLPFVLYGNVDPFIGIFINVIGNDNAEWKPWDRTEVATEKFDPKCEKKIVIDFDDEMEIPFIKVVVSAPHARFQGIRRLCPRMRGAVVGSRTKSQTGWATSFEAWVGRVGEYPGI
jgi:hypothetical protein